MQLEDLEGRATISIEEAGLLCGISRPTAYACARRGELPTLSLGRRRVVPVAALMKLLGNEEGADLSTPTSSTHNTEVQANPFANGGKNYGNDSASKPE